MENIICTIIKNEHKYLQEWIEYHLNLGFTHIYLFEDYGSKTHRYITDNYPNVTLSTFSDFGILKEEKQLGCTRQLSLYNKFIKDYTDKADWCAFIDCDEFISFSDGYNLQKITEEFADVNGIYICWQMYGASGLIYEESNKVQDRFKATNVLPEGEKSWSVKSFINLKNNNYNEMTSAHHGVNFVNTFKIETIRLIENYHKMFIKHYFTKSWQEWCNRWILRDESDFGNRTLDYFFEANPDMLPQYDELHKLAKEWMGKELYSKANKNKNRKY